MKCEVCERGPQTTGDALYRANEKGIKGVWRCQYHLNSNAREIANSPTGDIVRTIERAGK